MQTSMSLSKIVGPILGGMAISWIGSANTILVDVCSYVVSIISMLAIVKSFSTTSQKNHKNTFMQDIHEGITTVWSIKPVRCLMLFATLVNLVGPGMDVALLYRIQHELTLRSQWAGIIMTGLSGGMLLGSLVNRWAGKRINMNRWLTISSILQVVPPLVLSFTKNPLVICLIQIFIGVLLVAWNVQSVTLRQMLIPDYLLGRSSSAFRLSAWISIPLGDGMAGIMGQHFGTQVYFILAACVLFIVAVLKVYVRLEQVIPSTKPNAVSSGT
ncbi:MFS transporter [Alicyclobacillus acidoterrestris]|uniref:MFS transporter n=1 Tax=Alicyclobacillus acidoterrestris TaxID=1450 RepID=UPI003F52A9A1